MRTKALLLGAMIGAASLATSMAQVYSVNIVGYINVNVPHGFSLIANQLNNPAGNHITTLMPAPPAAITVYKFNLTTHQYDIVNWDNEYSYWDGPDVLLNPGDGFFVYNGGTAYTQTFVGEVQTGPTSIPFQQGFQLVSSKIPQQGLLQTALQYVPTSVGDTIYKYNTTTHIYDIYNYDGEYQYWDPVEPTINVGDGFFVLRGAAGGSWDRNFNVGP